jgi:hypothetical protein
MLGEARIQGKVHGAFNLAVSWSDGNISFHQFIDEKDARAFCTKFQLTFIEESDDDNSDIEG